MTELAAVAVGVYVVSLLAVAGACVVRAGRSEAGTILLLLASLAVLAAGGCARSWSRTGTWQGMLLVAAWLNVSLLVGTGGSPMRALLNSADLRRARGFGRWGRAPRPPGDTDRVVRGPLRWPALTLFLAGAGAVLLLRPEWVGIA
ncbi:hypothetical protein [Oerskovia enterophila]|uniref:hypothetical protein n=1 Tax=Oerskovia enterophila TaxID=43678 RepID=UPI00339282AD